MSICKAAFPLLIFIYAKENSCAGRARGPAGVPSSVAKISGWTELVPSGALPQRKSYALQSASKIAVCDFYYNGRFPFLEVQLQWGVKKDIQKAGSKEAR